MRRFHAITLLILSLSLSAYAAKPSLVSANGVIQDLEKTLQEVKQHSKVPVLFPTLVPKDPADKPYFASSDLSAQKYGISYLINIDKTKDCKGVHACNIGYVKAEQGGNPQVYYDLHNKELTTALMLPHHIKAYYTPGHAMGDYSPANIQWRDKNILYTIIWPTERDALVKMANSAFMIATPAN